MLRFVIFKFDATIREGLKSGWHGVDPAVGFIREEELLRAVPLSGAGRRITAGTVMWLRGAVCSHPTGAGHISDGIIPRTRWNGEQER